MSGMIAYYRVHLVDHDNQLVGTKYVVCDTDEDALDRVKAMVTSKLDAEVWDGARVIGVVSCRRVTSENAPHPGPLAAAG